MSERNQREKAGNQVVFQHMFPRDRMLHRDLCAHNVWRTKCIDPKCPRPPSRRICKHNKRRHVCIHPDCKKVKY